MLATGTEIRYEEQLGSEVSSGLVGVPYMKLCHLDDLTVYGGLDPCQVSAPAAIKSVGTLTSTHTHERDSPKMLTVLVEGRVEKRSGEKRGEEKRRVTVCYAFV